MLLRSNRQSLHVKLLVGAVDEHSTTALAVASSIPAGNKYLYHLHLVDLCLAVCIYEFDVCKCTHNMGIIGRVGQHSFFF